MRCLELWLRFVNDRMPHQRQSKEKAGWLELGNHAFVNGNLYAVRSSSIMNPAFWCTHVNNFRKVFCITSSVLTFQCNPTQWCFSLPFQIGNFPIMQMNVHDSVSKFDFNGLLYLYAFLCNPLSFSINNLANNKLNDRSGEWPNSCLNNIQKSFLYIAILVIKYSQRWPLLIHFRAYN